MASAEEWHPERQYQRVGRTAVNPMPARQQPGTAGFPQSCTTLQYQAVPALGLAVMIVIMATARGTLQNKKCMGTDRIAAADTDQNTQDPDTAGHGRIPAPRYYVETDGAGGSEVHSEAVAGAHDVPTHGALDCPPPLLFGKIPSAVAGVAAEQRGLPAVGVVDPGRAHRPRRVKQVTTSKRWHLCRAEAEDRGRPEARESRCIFVNTGPKTIAVHLQAGHTLVGHVRDQVAAREGIPSERQRLMYARKQLLEGDHTVEDYGVTQQCTLHLLGRVREGMPQAGGDGSSSSTLA